MKTGKQILIILVISIAAGLTANAINPKGVPLILDKNIYKPDTVKQKKISEDFVNDPFDTSKKSVTNVMQGKKNKEGFIEPANITYELAKGLFDRKALFIDARTKAEFDSVHVKGAINIPFEEFHVKSVEERAEIMRKFNKEGIIVVYCKGGKCEVSIDLAYEIAKLGFNSVNIYRGGIAEWKEKGYPTE
jgi:rhodanese-related sulfurtransferase